MDSWGFLWIYSCSFNPSMIQHVRMGFAFQDRLSHLGVGHRRARTQWQSKVQDLRTVIRCSKDMNVTSCHMRCHWVRVLLLLYICCVMYFHVFFACSWKGIQVGPVVRHGFLDLRNMSCRKGSWWVEGAGMLPCKVQPWRLDQCVAGPGKSYQHR